MFDMFITGMENENDMFDIDLNNLCVTIFAKYRPISQNTDQIQTNF